MRNNLIDERGAYKKTSFTGSNGTWNLISSESSGDQKGSVMNTIDTFKSDKGDIKSLSRKEVDALYESGKIK